MKSDNSLIRRLKNLAKKSELIVTLYSWYKLLRTIPVRDFLKLGKNIEKTRSILTVTPYTLLSYTKLSRLYDLACYLEKAAISGSFVECGVWNGGSAAVLAAVAKENLNRHIWLFDSWEGWPEPDERDYNNYFHLSPQKGGCLGSEERVRDILFRRLQLDGTRVHLVKGWFADTLPRKETGTIALLHLDCDLYESVKCCLEQLYDDVIDGGCIVIDDYSCWDGCKEAVTEFINRRKLKAELIKIDYEGVYFYKES
jgi:O-methyltransferase